MIPLIANIRKAIYNLNKRIDIIESSAGTGSGNNFSGDYNDLTNKPTIPEAQIQSDWNQTDDTKKDYIKNKPTVTNTDERLKTTSVSTNVTYYPVLGNNTSTAENKYIDSFGIKYNYNSASGQNGNSTLTLGNATASPDSSSRYGRLALYGTGSHCSTITSGNPTSDRSITFPDASGTVALIWTGTQAQYDAITTPDNNTIYIIIEEVL